MRLYVSRHLPRFATLGAIGGVLALLVTSSCGSVAGPRVDSGQDGRTGDGSGTGGASGSDGGGGAIGSDGNGGSSGTGGSGPGLRDGGAQADVGAGAGTSIEAGILVTGGIEAVGKAQGSATPAIVLSRSSLVYLGSRSCNSSVCVSGGIRP